LAQEARAPELQCSPRFAKDGDRYAGVFLLNLITSVKVAYLVRTLRNPILLATENHLEF
jgi:hypothetical protein